MIQSKVLSYERRVLLKGYLSLLRDLEGNGRTIHKVRTYITAISLKLAIDLDITEDYEKEIKCFIRQEIG